MHLVRYLLPGTDTPTIGVRNDNVVTPLSSTATIAELLRLPLAEFRRRLTQEPPTEAPIPVDNVQLLPPIDGRTEVWASGVTYERSRGARVEESSDGSIYQQVYDAARPELFFKAQPWRVVTHGEPVAIREDSPLNVPEPELALVLNRSGEILGLTACNDMSSRSIEGDNPLYLPQAKIYSGSCSLATGIRPFWQVEDPADLTIRMSIHRDGKQVWYGETSTSRLRRKLQDLVAPLFAGTDFPDGAVLATGTGIVPELSFTLHAGDRVEIEIDGVASLSNPVVRGREPMSWLVESLDQPNVRSVLR
ncbi:2-dehydro-3-deoxy-D-arabinonate dehydratase [Halopolyspora algeriensis]|uniref:2-dehydro-3-deoxy-D-arabinonate dehydratase n=1 Tax=Halopolyspora algeriensis TaxID=1500506 RepID=A0A368W1D3_9ACTN|nr:fumarylacetoacetate hydrolase family protein [Halopolyspora algeriensis]RCW45808.1 2-dehydro-3-deoxy-D-arabinonate dehydratase [Halopolyspora algeriensis]TQM54192.1 2-dehydro-3-deoxy-D-arabinonate dehydratase [Halopolyspora algeriensis]